MINALIALIIVAIIVGIVAWVVLQLLALLPMEPGFANIVRGLVLILAVLIVLVKALPLIGVSLGADLSKSLMSQSSISLIGVE